MELEIANLAPAEAEFSKIELEIVIELSITLKSARRSDAILAVKPPPYLKRVRLTLEFWLVEVIRTFLQLPAAGDADKAVNKILFAAVPSDFRVPSTTKSAEPPIFTVTPGSIVKVLPEATVRVSSSFIMYVPKDCFNVLSEDKVVVCEIK